MILVCTQCYPEPEPDPDPPCAACKRTLSMEPVSVLDTFGLMSRCASLTAMLSLRRHQSSQHEPGVGRHAGCTGQVQPGRIAESGGRVASAGAGHGGSSRPVRAETCHLSSHDDRRPKADPVPDRCLHLAASVYICADAGFLSPTTSVQYNTNPTAPIAVSADNDVNACSQGRQGLGHVAAAPRAVVRPQLHFQPSQTSSTAEGALMFGLQSFKRWPQGQQPCAHGTWSAVREHTERHSVDIQEGTLHRAVPL